MSVKVKITHRGNTAEPWQEELEASYFTLNSGVAEIWVEQAQSTHIIYIPPTEYARLDVISSRRDIPKQENSWSKKPSREFRQRDRRY